MTDRSPDLVWRKSSYSGETGGNCVEVAHIPSRFRKSSYSGRDQDCVEVAQFPPEFSKSSYSGGNNECVEVGAVPYGAAIRDSKHPDAGHLPFPASEWTSFLSSALK